MKKIVALVLSLAMVLALGTVAFASYDYLAKDGNTYIYDAENDELIAYGIPASVAASQTVVDGKVTRGMVAHNRIQDTCYVSAKETDDGAVVLYKDGKVAGYALIINPYYEYTGAEFTKFGTGCGEVALTDAAKAAGTKLYTIDGVDGKYFKATNTDVDGYRTKVGNAVLNLVSAEGDYTVKAHAFKYDTTAGKVTKIYCDNCKKSFEFTTSKTVRTTYTSYDTVTIDGTPYYVNLGAAAAEAGTASNVTSAKTFDAGVAMYAGLALMSVAGSAVVIGKKKEF